MWRRLGAKAVMAAMEPEQLQPLLQSPPSPPLDFPVGRGRWGWRHHRRGGGRGALAGDGEGALTGGGESARWRARPR